MRCRDCGTEIPQARMEAAPGTKWCVKCVDRHVLPKRGFISATCKSKGYELVVEDGGSVAAQAWDNRAERNERRGL